MSPSVLEYAPPPPPAGSMRRDLLSAYAAAGAKAASWAVVSALVIRLDAGAFALLALVRATLGLLNYTAVGLGPGMVWWLAANRNGEADAAARPYANGVALSLLAGAAGLLLTLGYAHWFPLFHALPAGIRSPFWLVAGVGGGTVLRLMSDAPAAVLQTRGRIATDNGFLAAAELTWVALCGVAAAGTRNGGSLLAAVGAAYAASGAVLLSLRFAGAARMIGRWRPDWRRVTPAGLWQLLAFGSVVTVAQLADFLYAPTDFVLINRLIGPAVVAVYAPAVQIDAGLLLAVSGLAAVLLPKTALAHAAGDRRAVRDYYVRGTLGSVALLVPAAAAVWLAAPWLLRVWLGAELPETRAILPLVLIHTVVGGSSAVGRSVLLAMGRAKPFAASVLVAGGANVLLSYAFVRFGGLGLPGIVYGTLVAVIARCAVWTPWYVLKVLGEQEAA